MLLYDLRLRIRVLCEEFCLVIDFFVTDKKPPKDWPEKGTIVFDRVSLSYSNNEPSGLKNVSFSIRPAEKVGIMGSG
jgi:ABC-type multidrug transport system fused ATPase/permease subunit